MSDKPWRDGENKWKDQHGVTVRIGKKSVSHVQPQRQYALLALYRACGYAQDFPHSHRERYPPLALGRKNWLFCGNDASAYRAAIVYSLLTSCRAADVNPRQWLEHVLIEIPTRRKSDQSMEDLLPMEYAKRPDTGPWNLTDPD